MDLLVDVALPLPLSLAVIMLSPGIGLTLIDFGRVLATMVRAITEHPEWQDRLTREVLASGDGPMTPEMATRMPLTDQVFKEALRLLPPVPLLPRGALKDFEWNGVHVPAGCTVTANVTMAMRSAAHYTGPDRFDPERFSPERVEDRSHRFCWIPFGGGAHKCIGMHFATLQVRTFVRSLLRRRRTERSRSGPVQWRRLPTARPADGLPVVLRAR